MTGVQTCALPIWEYVRYRLGLFSDTLDGTAVHAVVTGLASDGLSLSLRRRVGDGRGLVSWLCRVNPVRATVNVYALLVSLLVIGALGLRRRLCMGARILFFILLLTLVAAFIFATPQATGPHHAFMVYPFNHVLVAFALSKCVG